MTKDELIAWAKANGWREDRYGHLQRTSCMPEGCPREIRTYRLKQTFQTVPLHRRQATGGGGRSGPMFPAAWLSNNLKQFHIVSRVSPAEC